MMVFIKTKNNWPKVFVESEYYNKILINQIKKILDMVEKNIKEYV